MARSGGRAGQGLKSLSGAPQGHRPAPWAELSYRAVQEGPQGGWAMGGLGQGLTVMQPLVPTGPHCSGENLA